MIFEVRKSPVSGDFGVLLIACQAQQLWQLMAPVWAGGSADTTETSALALPLPSQEAGELSGAPVTLQCRGKHSLLTHLLPLSKIPYGHMSDLTTSVTKVFSGWRGLAMREECANAAGWVMAGSLASAQTVFRFLRSEFKCWLQGSSMVKMRGLSFWCFEGWR